MGYTYDPLFDIREEKGAEGDPSSSQESLPVPSPSNSDRDLSQVAELTSHGSEGSRPKAAKDVSSSQSCNDDLICRYSYTARTKILGR